MIIRPIICRFTIPGEPQGKGRARSQAIYGRGGKPVMKDGRIIITHHTPEKTVAYEGLIAHEATLAMAGKPPIEVPCELHLAIVCTVPASWSLRKTREALAGLIRPAKKPDFDNILKAVADGCNGVVWKDDVQAVDGSWSKRYGTIPGVTVTVLPIAPIPLDQPQRDLLAEAA